MLLCLCYNYYEMQLINNTNKSYIKVHVNGKLLIGEHLNTNMLKIILLLLKDNLSF